VANAEKLEQHFHPGDIRRVNAICRHCISVLHFSGLDLTQLTFNRMIEFHACSRDLSENVCRCVCA